MLTNYMDGANETDVADVFDTHYPDDPVQGSPFNTGSQYAFLQYKRLSAIQGDLVFQAPRRFLLDHSAHRQPAWSFRTCPAPGQASIVVVRPLNLFLQSASATRTFR